MLDLLPGQALSSNSHPAPNVKSSKVETPCVEAVFGVKHSFFQGLVTNGGLLFFKKQQCYFVFEEFFHTHGSSSLQLILRPREIVIVVTTGVRGGCYWHLVGRRQRCC